MLAREKKGLFFLHHRFDSKVMFFRSREAEIQLVFGSAQTEEFTAPHHLFFCF